MAYSDVILADSPVGYWKLDETSGTTATDSSANSNDGTISGSPTMGANGLVFEPSGKCIDFDGTDDVVTITPATIAGSAVSFECWVGTSAAASTNIYLADGNPNRFTFAWNSTTSGQLGVYDGTSWSDFGAANNDGKGHHVVFVLNGTTAKCYVDGVQLGADQTIVAIDWSAITALALGRDYTAASNYFTGKYQKAAIYNAALTPLQIREHYQAGIAQGFHKEVLTLNPTAYYPLNEATGDAIDWSGNDNNGTLSGDITQGATGNLAYDDSTGYAFAGVDGEISITHPASTTTYSLVALVELTSATGEYKILEDNGVGHWSISAGRQNLNYSASDHLADTSLVNGQIAVIGLSVNAGAVSFYLNGAPDGTDTAAIALDFETISDAATSFNGSLLGISIYDSALTAAQHRTIAQSARTLIESRGYPKVISNLNPSGYWRLGEASGTTAFDESGNGNDGTINGSPVMATNDGALHQSRLKAMTFDGVDDGVTIPDDPTLNYGLGDFYVGGWFKISSTANITTQLMLVVKGDGGAGNKRYFLFVSASGEFTLHIDDNTTLKEAKETGVDSRDDTYHLVVGIRDGNNLRLSVDGVDVATTDITGYGNIDDTDDFLIGLNAPNTSGQELEGDAGEVFTGSGAITTQQIKQIYEAGRSRYAAEVISYEPVNFYRQDEVSGNSIDLGSLGNDGVWTGSPTYEQASEVISNEPSNKSIAVTTAESLAFTSHAATTTYSLLSIIKPTGVTGSQEIFTDGTDSLKLNGSNLSLFYSATEHNSNTTLVAGEAHMVGVSVDAGAATFYLDGAPDGTAASATSFAPIKLYDFTFAGTGDEAAVFDVALTNEQYLDIFEMASYALTSAFGITGVITESLPATDFFVRASQLDTGAFIADAVVQGDNTYTIDFGQIAGYENYADEVLLTALPKTGKRRLDSTAYSVGDYYLPADVTTNDHIYEVTVAGTTAASEPTLDQAGGTTVDGTVTVQDRGVCPTPQTQIDYATNI